MGDVTLSDVLDEDLLLDLAGDRYFEHGVDDFERGLLHSLAQYEERITAKVYGTETYPVQLWLEDDVLCLVAPVLWGGGLILQTLRCCGTRLDCGISPLSSAWGGSC